MFGFGRPKDPDMRALRKEGRRIVAENHRLRGKIESQAKEMSVMREELRRLECIVREYQEMIFKKKGLKYNKKDDHDDDGHLPKKPGAPIGHKGTTREIPKKVDEHKDVRIDHCPDCGLGDITPCQR